MKLNKLVLTGAAGRLGSYLREPLSKMADQLVSTDIAEGVGQLYPNETFVQADLAQFQPIHDLLESADMVVHFGAIVDEAPFETLLGPNFVGSYNVWEGAYRQGVRRVIYASSIHLAGMHPKQDFIGLDCAHRPDGFYGLAKCFSEDLGRMYWDKRKLECVCLRILSAAQVTSPRALGSYLSYDDLIHLVTRAIDTPTVGFTAVWGVSNNDRAPVDNRLAGHLGYRPKDNAEVHAEKILSEAKAGDPSDPAQMFHGGPFAAVEIGSSGLAQMTIVDDRKTT